MFLINKKNSKDFILQNISSLTGQKPRIAKSAINSIEKSVQEHLALMSKAVMIKLEQYNKKTISKELIEAATAYYAGFVAGALTTK